MLLLRERLNSRLLRCGEGALGRGGWCVLAWALAVRALVAFWLLGGMPMVGDAARYAGQASRFLVDFPGSAPYYWPPGTSYYLAAWLYLWGDSLTVARLAAVAAALLCVALVLLLTARVLGGGTGVLAAGWIAAFYPPSVMMAGQAYSQHLAAACLLGLAYGLVRLRQGAGIRWWAASGFALGCGILVRPSMVSLLPVLGLLAAYIASGQREEGRMGRATAGAAAGIAVCLGLLAPVVFHNARLGAGWVLSTNNERNFFLGNNRFTPDYKTSHLAQRSLGDLDGEARAYLKGLLGTNSPGDRRAMVKEALRYISTHKLRTCWRIANRIRSFWGFDYLMSRNIQKHMGLGGGGLLILLLGEAGGYLLLMFLALGGLIFARKLIRCGGLLVVLILAYQAPYALAFSGGTYHFPVVWLLMPAAGVLAAEVRAHAGLVIGGLLRRKLTALAYGLFFLVQVEYAWYAALYAR